MQSMQMMRYVLKLIKAGNYLSRRKAIDKYSAEMKVSTLKKSAREMAW
jgi:hypothetical protein